MSASPQNPDRDTMEEQKDGTQEEKEEKEEAQPAWTGFLYDPRSGEFLGRTCSSWGEFCRTAEPRPAPGSAHARLLEACLSN